MLENFEVRSTIYGYVYLIWQLDSEAFKVPEKYVCQLYGGKREGNVNDARYKMCKDTYEKKMVIPDLSLLPPCQETLTLHCR